LEAAGGEDLERLKRVVARFAFLDELKVDWREPSPFEPSI